MVNKSICCCSYLCLPFCISKCTSESNKAFLLRPKPSIEDLEYKALDKLRGNAEFAANRDYADYEKFGSIIFCNTSFNSRIESANYSKQMDLSEWDTAIKDYENERSKCRDFNPWNVATACNLTVSTTLTYEKHNLLFKKVCSVAYGLLTVAK